VVDLEGDRVDPLTLGEAPLRVFVFTRADCPISNRYAPELKRLHEKFAGQDVGFWLVYPNPDATAETIRKHLKEYSYTMPALRDPDHQLVKYVQAKVTPEVAVFDEQGTLVYRGRIDDRYIALGKARESVSQRDLHNAINALQAGQAITTPRTEAVGCYIVDLQ
jgi:uncharacterized protein with LGFP repeats